MTNGHVRVGSMRWLHLVSLGPPKNCCVALTRPVVNFENVLAAFFIYFIYLFTYLFIFLYTLFSNFSYLRVFFFHKNPVKKFPNFHEYIKEKIRIAFHVVRVTESSIGQGSTLCALLSNTGIKQFVVLLELFLLTAHLKIFLRKG